MSQATYGSVDNTTHRLDTLVDHGFISGWRRERRRWIIQFGHRDEPTYGESRPYTLKEVVAWLDGANDMGVGGRRG